MLSANSNLFQTLAAATLSHGSSEGNASDFLVCGLGSLGQFCVSALKEFGVPVRAINLTMPDRWEIPNLPELVDDLIIGDCRQADLLSKVGIDHCRAVLLVTSDERINIETAFAIRLLNPEVRLVVRSAKQNLNDLLGAHLGNFVAFEATQLPAPAFAIAALGSEIRGFIELENSLMRVVKVPITPDHPWCGYRLMHELNTRNRRVLSYIPEGMPLPTVFYDWEPDHRVKAGDTIAYIELIEQTVNLVQAPQKPSPRLRAKSIQRWQAVIRKLSGAYLREKGLQLWRSLSQTKRVGLVVGMTMVSLLFLGTCVIKLNVADTGWLKAFYTSGVMLLGSYDTVLGALDPKDAIPLWLRYLNLSYMLAGTASIAVLYALLTESLLSANFQLPKRRPPVPEQGHVVLIGLGRVGRRVATFLQSLKQPLVGVNPTPLEQGVLPQLPLVVSDLNNALSKVNLETARSVVIATDDEMANLELGLMAHAINPNCALVIRTFDPQFSNSIDRLLPYAKVLSAYSLAAEAFVAAAFGENILNVLRLNEQTVLVTEYLIESGDTLDGLLLAEIAYGYGVVPILYQKPGDNNARLLPSDDLRVRVGDRLVLLGSNEGLQRIERGETFPRHWYVRVERALSRDAAFEGITAIACISSCDIAIAHDLMNNLPGILPIALYKHQAQRLVRELVKSQVMAHLVAAPPKSPASPAPLP